MLSYFKFHPMTIIKIVSLWWVRQLTGSKSPWRHGNRSLVRPRLHLSGIHVHTHTEGREGIKQFLKYFLLPFFLFFLSFFFFFFLVFRDRVSLYSPGCPATHFVDQASLELRNLPASGLLGAGIKGMHHHAWQSTFFNGKFLNRCFLRNKRI